MNLILTQVIELNNALNADSLRSRHISGESRIRLSRLKQNIKNELNLIGQIEKDIFKEFNINLLPSIDGTLIPDGDKENFKIAQLKIVETRKAWNMEINLNFVPEKELLEYCKEVNTSTESILFEYLLEGPRQP